MSQKILGNRNSMSGHNPRVIGRVSVPRVSVTNPRVTFILIFSDIFSCSAGIQCQFQMNILFTLKKKTRMKYRIHFHHQEQQLHQASAISKITYQFQVILRHFMYQYSSEGECLKMNYSQRQHEVRQNYAYTCEPNQYYTQSETLVFRWKG